MPLQLFNTTRCLFWLRVVLALNGLLIGKVKTIS